MPEVEQWLGSGVIIGDGSMILTNRHVVQSFIDAAEKDVLRRQPGLSERQIKAEVAKMTIGVEINDSQGEMLHFSGDRGREQLIFYGLSIAPDDIYLDRLSDMAVINLNRVVGPPLSIKRNWVDVGETVYALGFPSGPESHISVSKGPVAALPELPAHMPDLVVKFIKQLAFDADLAAVNGFSGGAMVTTDGLLAGLMAVVEKEIPRTYGISGPGVIGLLREVGLENEVLGIGPCEAILKGSEK